jgi:hypothetical protein
MRATLFVSCATYVETGSSPPTRAFHTHLTRCTSLFEPDEIVIFTVGLRKPLKTDVDLQAASTLEDAMSLARAYEHRRIVTTPPSATTTPHSSSCQSGSSITPTPHQAASTTPGAPQRQSPPPTGSWMIWLTPDEMTRRYEGGLCSNCLEKFSRDHLKRCSMTGIYLSLWAFRIT